MPYFSINFIISLAMITCTFSLNIVYCEARNESSSVNDTVEVTSMHEMEQKCPKELNETEEDSELDTCVLFAFQAHEYILFDNETVYVPSYKKYYNRTSYDFECLTRTLRICGSSEEINERTAKFPVSFSYLTLIGLVISIICITLHLIVFFIVPDMRNLPGYNLASLCFSLLFGYISFIVAQAESVVASGLPCLCVALALQFFLLASFLWMFIMAFDVYRSLLNATGKLRVTIRKFSRKRYCFYCVYSWGMPLLFVIGTVIMEKANGIPENLRPMIGEKMCWFKQKTPLLILFAAPIMVVVVLNMIFFGLSAYIIYTNRMKVEDSETFKGSLKRTFLLHSRLATIMGLTWVVAILANVINMIWLWYIYILLNTLQGLFIFLAFTCTQKVKKNVIMMLPSQKRNISATSTPTSTETSTFQSYSNTGLSMENDVDLTTEVNRVKTEKV